jgi:hypothetical protein
MFLVPDKQEKWQSILTAIIRFPVFTLFLNHGVHGVTMLPFYNTSTGEVHIYALKITCFGLEIVPFVVKNR